MNSVNRYMMGFTNARLTFGLNETPNHIIITRQEEGNNQVYKTRPNIFIIL